MSTYQNTTNNSFVAGSATNIYRMATLAADGAVDAVATKGAFADGIFAETVSAGQAVGLVKPDFCVAKLEVGGAVAVGDDLISDTSGRGITTASAGHSIMAKATSLASASGEIVSVVFGYRGETA